MILWGTLGGNEVSDSVDDDEEDDEEDDDEEERDLFLFFFFSFGDLDLERDLRR